MDKKILHESTATPEQKEILIRSILPKLGEDMIVRLKVGASREELENMVDNEVGTLLNTIFGVRG